MDEKKPIVKPIVKPMKPVVVKQMNKKTIESYSSTLGNLYTTDDPTLDKDVSILTDRGYWGDVVKSLTIYDSDELVAGLVDRMRYTANQNYNYNISDKYVKEDEFWKDWGNGVNEIADNTLMGLSNVFRQMFQSLITTGMAIPDVKWDTVRINGKKYEVPTKISVLPVLATKLLPGKYFGEEKVWVSINEEIERENLQVSDSDMRYDIRYFGDPESPEFNKRQPAIRKDNAQAIKYNWNPNNPTLYPTPLLKRAFHSVSLRHKYIESDISLLNGIIERIIQVKVGDKEIELYGDDDDGYGDLTLASQMFDEDTITQMIVTPYYYDIQIIQPDVQDLLKQDKYIQTTMSIMNAFGIILDPDSSSNTSNDEGLNIVLFKENIKELQDHVSSFMRKLCREIKRRNPKLKSIPNFTFDIPDFEDTDFKTQLIQLYNFGLLDAESVLEKFSFDPDTIFERLKKQKRIEAEDDILQVRTTFKQSTNDAGKEKTSEISDNGGRPKKGSEKKETISKNVKEAK